MKMSAFRTLIREEIKKVLTEGNDELLTMIRDYASDNYSLDQGYGSEYWDAEDNMKQIKAKIIKLKGRKYFEIVKDYANFKLWADEYAGPSTRSENEAAAKEYSKKLGFTLNDLDIDYY